MFMHLLGPVTYGISSRVAGEETQRRQDTRKLKTLMFASFGDNGFMSDVEKLAKIGLPQGLPPVIVMWFLILIENM
jgi:hypothetical protein